MTLVGLNKNIVITATFDEPLQQRPILSVKGEQNADGTITTLSVGTNSDQLYYELEDNENPSSSTYTRTHKAGVLEQEDLSADTPSSLIPVVDVLGNTSQISSSEFLQLRYEPIDMSNFQVYEPHPDIGKKYSIREGYDDITFCWESDNSVLVIIGFERAFSGGGMLNELENLPVLPQVFLGSRPITLTISPRILTIPRFMMTFCDMIAGLANKTALVKEIASKIIHGIDCLNGNVPLPG